MKRVATLLLVIIMVLGLAGGPVAYGAGEAVTTPPLIITELKIKTGGSTDEFIELTNVSDEAVELGGYALLYFNSAAPADLTHPTKGPIALPNAQLSADTSVVFAKNTAEVPNAQSMGIDPLSDAAGLVQLVAAGVEASAARKVYDQVAWSSATNPPVGTWPVGTSTNTATKSQSLQRQPNEQGEPELTNAQWVLGDPQPQSSMLILPPPPVDPEPASMPEPVAQSEPAVDEEAVATPVAPEFAESDPEVEPEPAPEVVEPVPTTSHLPIHITELLPNPASPATDANDEFVEVYNPNSQAVDLSGYKIQAGSTYNYSFTPGAITLAPGEYKAFYSSGSTLTLSNTAGQARVLDPTGAVVSEASAYKDAPDGSAWASINGVWQWTTAPTPNAANVLSQTVKFPTTAKSTSPAKKAATKAATTAKKASTASTKAATTSKKAAAAGKAAAKDAGLAGATKPKSFVHPAILAGVGIAALGYGVYEYRQDVANRIEQFKRNRAARRAAGGKA